VPPSQLPSQHDRASFDRGEPSLNRYRSCYAGQDNSRRVYRVFVASSPDAPRRIDNALQIQVILDRSIRLRIVRAPRSTKSIGRTPIVPPACPVSERELRSG